MRHKMSKKKKKKKKTNDKKKKIINVIGKKSKLLRSAMQTEKSNPWVNG